MRAEELDVVVVGGANTDFLIRGPSLPGPGRSVEGDTFQQAPGGKGANQAVGAARLEATVALIARIGHDARGDAILSRLADERVDAKAVLRDAEAETGAVLVMVDASGEKQTMSALGANQKLAVRDVAGDAFSAALAVCIAKGEDVASAARFASAAAALKTTRLGAQAGLPRREEVLRLIRST